MRGLRLREDRIRSAGTRGLDVWVVARKHCGEIRCGVRERSRRRDVRMKLPQESSESKSKHQEHGGKCNDIARLARSTRQYGHNSTIGGCNHGCLPEKMNQRPADGLKSVSHSRSFRDGL